MAENTNATDYPGHHAQLYPHVTTTAPTLQQLYDQQIGNYTYDPGHVRSRFQDLPNHEHHAWVPAASLDQLMRAPNGTMAAYIRPADSTLDPNYLSPDYILLPPSDPYKGQLRPDPLVNTGRLWAFDDGRAWNY